MRYLDTSCLVALYYPELRTNALISHLQRRPLPLVLTALQEIEFTNGLHLKVFRKEATNAAVTATLTNLKIDAARGVFHRAQPAWNNVSAEVIHLAAALELGATEFVTGDERQAKAARKENLNVILI